VLQVQYLPTECTYMPSDVLTKQLPKAVHWRQAYVILGHMALQWEKRVEEVAAGRPRSAQRVDCDEQADSWLVKCGGRPHSVAQEEVSAAIASRARNRRGGVMR
jgi:hypothetical protein